MIEAGATVRGSVLLDDVRVEAGAAVVDAIVGPGCVIGAGKKLTGGITAAGERI